MVCSMQKVKVAVKSAKMGSSSNITNSISKIAAKWLVYASTVTYCVSISPRLAKLLLRFSTTVEFYMSLVSIRRMKSWLHFASCCSDA